MRLRSLRSSQCHFTSQFGVEGGPQERQRPEPFDPTQPRLDVQEDGGEPALCLVRGTLAIDVIGALPHEGIDRFEAVGGLQAHREGSEYPRRWRVRVSSKPSSRFFTADSFSPRSTARSRGGGPPSLRHGSAARRPPGAFGARSPADSWGGARTFSRLCH